MKVFISWSGERSRLVAELLSEWIQCVLQAVEPWLSSKDIDRGSLWFMEITNQLSNTHNGIVCLTKTNVTEPWILFESGALAKGLSSSRVFTFLIDLQPTDVKDPLAQFNHTLPTKQGLYALINTINKGLDSYSLKDRILLNVFNTYWPQFESEFAKIVDLKEEEQSPKVRPQEELLLEVLSSIRGVDKRLRRIEDSELSKNMQDLNDPISLSTPLEKFDFSVRASNVLRSCDFRTVSDIMNADLDQYRNIGSKSRQEILDMRETVKSLLHKY